MEQSTPYAVARAFRAAAAAALVWIGPASAATSPGAVPSAPSATVEPKERLVLRIDADGDPRVVDRQAVTEAPPEMPKTDPTRENLVSAPLKGPLSAASDTVVVSLWSAEHDTRLKVENGFGQPIAYSAVLIGHRNGRTISAPTSTCPVKAHGVSVETWPDAIDGIALTKFRVIANGDLSCNGGSTLAVAAGSPPQPPPAPAENTCQAGEVVRGNLAIELQVSPADGAVRSGMATWTLNSGKSPVPAVLLDYPLTGEAPAPAPAFLRVFEMIGTNPPSASPTASIVVLADGVERTRRPWNGYAQSRSAPPRNGQRPVAYAGVVPFNPKKPDGTPDDGLAALLADIGAGKVAVLEVRVVGSSGETLGSSQLAVGASPARDPAALGPMLAQARAKAAAPDHCAPQRQASR